MRWRGKRRSGNIEDLRGAGPAAGGGGGGGLLNILFWIFRLFGFKGVAVAAAGLGAFAMFGGDISGLLGGGGSSVQPRTGGEIRQSADEKELSEFVSVVLADTEDTWHALFKAQGSTYEEPRLVMFRGAVRSACGLGQAAMGPFYCPADKKIYIDLSFYDDLRERHDAPGDFAQAYVIAHEVGHHVQTLLGISGKVRAAKARVDKVAGNQLSVKQELQADCFAGLWAHHAQRSRALLESGDLEEGLRAAAAIGDDRLQKQSKGHVTPDSFTHGSSAQRVQWFRTGWKQGTLAACNTFAG